MKIKAEYNLPYLKLWRNKNGIFLVFLFVYFGMLSTTPTALVLTWIGDANKVVDSLIAFIQLTMEKCIIIHSIKYDYHAEIFFIKYRFIFCPFD